MCVFLQRIGSNEIFQWRDATTADKFIERTVVSLSVCLKTTEKLISTRWSTFIILCPRACVTAVSVATHAIAAHWRRQALVVVDIQYVGIAWTMYLDITDKRCITAFVWHHAATQRRIRRWCRPLSLITVNIRRSHSVIELHCTKVVPLGIIILDDGWYGMQVVVWRCRLMTGVDICTWNSELTATKYTHYSMQQIRDATVIKYNTD